MTWLLTLFLALPALSAEKPKVEVKEIGRIPASSQSALGGVRGLNQCDIIYRIDDSDKPNVCYVVKTCSNSGEPNIALNCLKQ